MVKIKNLLLGLPSAVIIFSAVLVPVTYAENGAGTGGGTSSGEHTTTPPPPKPEHTGDNGGTTTSTTETHNSTSPTEVKVPEKTEMETEFHTQGNGILNEAEKNHPGSKKEDRLKKCEQNKTGIEQRSTNFVTNSQKFLAHINEVFTKVQAYKTTNNLTVTDYDALVAAATTAQTQATASVDALASLKPVLDCTADTAPANVATFKAAAVKAKTDLSNYRKAVKALLVAVAAAKDQGVQQ